MGLRPSMLLLCGIDDLKVNKFKIVDPRVSGDSFKKLPLEMPVPPNPGERGGFNARMRYLMIRDLVDSVRGNRSKIDDLTQWDPEFGVKNVVGYVVDELEHGNDCLYAMAAIDPKYAEAGYSVLPQVELEQDVSNDAAALRIFKHDGVGDAWSKVKGYARGANRKKRLLCGGHNYAFFSDYWNGYRDITLYLFDLLGLKTTEKELKLMLYWQWS